MLDDFFCRIYLDALYATGDGKGKRQKVEANGKSHKK